ncbi:MAG TPA: glycosyltransferase [Flavobacteriaceae bacterium]|nr:hypothetical protein [Flavobacteriaceae bacterium]MCB9213484.1 hypothetical protein [Alteromonas sp.]HPF12213.1 glycosyltransferase [Flavobacteriaceae bacterium]HQU22000.1 glycosyltransferase [Flavobacteriaceae bacterium]HQU65899.1 glycosyltransferase [Flavobacteriaceae bacterium]
MRKVLFITWDGPQTSYLEGLFLPIFGAVSEKSDFHFHVMQFGWADASKQAVILKAAESVGIPYTFISVHRKPLVTLGTAFTIFKGSRVITDYCNKNGIDILMPRSTFPAMMVLRMKTKLPIVFDADGLPLEERLDFSGLSAKSKQYLFLKSKERQMLFQAHHIITRSQKAIDWHLKAFPSLDAAKFSVVINGRDAERFRPNDEKRKQFRKELGIHEDDEVFVYCGSLGPQYGWSQMMAVFEGYRHLRPKSLFYILTGNMEYAHQNVPKHLASSSIIRKVSFQEVPKYLNMADVGFAIREPLPSMKGVAPIKLGEYLLCGLFVVASKGIGDTDRILEKVPGSIVFDHDQDGAVEETVQALLNRTFDYREANRKVGVAYFSLAESAASYLRALNRIV